MRRSRLKRLASRGLACALLTGTLFAGQAPVSHAEHRDDSETGHTGCWGESETIDQPSGLVDTGSGDFLVGSAFGKTFVAVDGDASGVEVYGRLDTRLVFGNEQWYRIQVEPDGTISTCGKGHSRSFDLEPLEP